MVTQDPGSNTSQETGQLQGGGGARQEGLKTAFIHFRITHKQMPEARRQVDSATQV